MKLADALRDLGQHDEALKEFEALLDINPNYTPGRVHYGIALYSAGRRAEAVRVWEDVLARHPGNKSAEMYLNLVREPAQEGGKDGAIG
jgi:tetratricopeptide (TPR) repeat protein